MLHGQAKLLEESTAQGLANRSHRQRPGRRDRRGMVRGPLENGGVVDQHVAQAQPHGFLAADPASGQEEIGRRLMPDRSRECDAQGEAVMEAEPGEVGAETTPGLVHIRKSADMARPNPPPMAAPCTAATTGSGEAKSRSALR